MLFGSGKRLAKRNQSQQKQHSFGSRAAERVGRGPPASSSPSIPGPASADTPSALSSSFGSSKSLQPIEGTPPLRQNIVNHGYKPKITPSGHLERLQHSDGAETVALDSRPRDHGLADHRQQVTRSQSQRYPSSSSATSPGSASLDNLDLAGTSSFVVHAAKRVFASEQQHSKQTSTTGQLTSKFIDGGPNRGLDTHEHARSVSALDAQNTGTSSQFDAGIPAALRGALQHSSFDQRAVDRHSQALPRQPSPLRDCDSGELREPYLPAHPRSTVRPVRPSVAPSVPSSPDDSDCHHPGSDPQRRREDHAIGQAAFDPSEKPRQNPHPTNQQPVRHTARQEDVAGHPDNRAQKAEPALRLSHDSPATDSEHRFGRPAQGAPKSPEKPLGDSPVIPDNTSVGREHARTVHFSLIYTPSQAATAQPSRPRSLDSKEKVMREQAQQQPGPPPSYRQVQQPQHAQNAQHLPQNNMSLPPPPPNNGGQNPNFRSGSVVEGFRTGSVTDRQHDQGSDIQGRASPQPPTGDREDQEKQFKDLLTKYKNVKRLYFDGKKEIEQLGGQIEQLQNAVANQRMSQSRTALDDSEYSTRFNRLNGAINNLAFNIRKDWVKLPSWLLPYVSTDALKTGKQEMTAVGRAVITRWMVDEIFNRCFHPSLEPEMSRQLKTIEQNIRHFSYTLNSQEEYEALTTKVVSWRMATLEGLQDLLRSPEAQDHRLEFTRRASSNLTASLLQHLTDPPPAGVDGSAGMIVELAVGIACNMPLESRDVAVIYPLPEQPIQPEIMEMEKTGLPPLELTRLGADASAGDDGDDNAGSGKEGGKDGGKRGAGPEKGRTGSMLTSFLGTGNTPGSRKSSVAVDGAGSGGQPAQGSAPSAPQGASKDAANKVRFAGFVAVEVRGRQVLMKAPVWPLG